MDPQAFKTQWRGWYSKGPPVGFLLRQLHREQWLRIHSLPGGQRYPGDAADWKELLARHNAVATEVLGEGSPCVVVTCHFVEGAQAMPTRLADASWPEPEALKGLGLTRLGPLDDSWPGEVVRAKRLAGDGWLYAAAHDWRRGAYDGLLRAVAEDETGPVLFVSCLSGQVYAPYDGGADLFFQRSSERELARERYRAWLSPLPSGL